MAHRRAARIPRGRVVGTAVAGMAVALAGLFASAMPAAAATRTQSPCVEVRGVCHVPIQTGGGAIIHPH